MIAQGLFTFFIDPILRAPTIGCMLMCLTAGLMGVFIFLRKQSLIGEALSHTAYPGVILGAMIAGLLSIEENDELFISLSVFFGAFLTASLGIWSIQALEKWMKVPRDAALCFVLSTFFGVGLTLTSEVQFSLTAIYRQVLTYFYGQAATMTDIHIVIYGILALIVLVVICSLYKELQVVVFDRRYAQSLGIRVDFIENLLFFLVALAVIIGIRSVGVVLMSAMLIAPAVAARQFTSRLSVLLILAAFFGMGSGFLGNYFSVQLTETLSLWYPAARIILPTGPMIVVVAMAICIFSLLFAPERGLLVRLWRMANFRHTCVCENILKVMFRLSPHAALTIRQLAKYQTLSLCYLNFLLSRMARKGWIEGKKKHGYRLKKAGYARAEKIVRLHRLWEVYIVHNKEKGNPCLHCSFEEMEQILTPELERKLTSSLPDKEQELYFSSLEELHVR